MKYLLLLLFLSACSSSDWQPIGQLDFSTAPLFKMNQKVVYKVPPFYQIVCSGQGTVRELVVDIPGSFQYRVSTPNEEPDCPASYVIRETELKAAK
jgi:hypothetical protein